MSSVSPWWEGAPKQWQPIEEGQDECVLLAVEEPDSVKEIASTERRTVSDGKPTVGLDGGIVTDPRIWGNKHIIAGTRLPVFMIEDLYVAGFDSKAIVGMYPHVSEADVHIALAFAQLNRGIIQLEREEQLETETGEA